MKKTLLLLLAIAIAGLGCAGDGLKTVDLEESDRIFPNPERGFYRPTMLPDLQSLPNLRGEGVTHIYGKVRANDFRDKDFSRDFLAKIRNGFNVARSAGVKVIFCVSYGDRIGAPDASKERIFRHIEQLQPIWERSDLPSASWNDARSIPVVMTL